MTGAIPVGLLTELSCELSNEELGAAVRLIARLCEVQRPIPLKTVHISAGMDKKSWLEISDSILAFFEVTDTDISLPVIEQQDDEQMISIRTSNRELAMNVRSRSRPKVPHYHEAEKPEAISIRKAIFDQGVALFQREGKSMNTARSMLATLLKNYSEGDVAMAISDAATKDAIAEPYSFILARLKSNSKKKRGGYGTNAAPPVSKNQIVTPQITGISEQKAERIRRKNREIRQKMEANKP